METGFDQRSAAGRAICSRASGSSRWWLAWGSQTAMGRRAAMALRWLKGVPPRPMCDSNAWVRASLPPAAVTAGGSLSISAGSMATTWGISLRSAIASLRLASGSVNTGAIEALSPEPAVVGTEARGGAAAVPGTGPPS